MTLFVNFRAGPYGAVCSPFVMEGDALADPPGMNSLLWQSIPPLARGRRVILAAHGFNVPYVDSLRSLARLEAALDIGPHELFLGVTWPGDWILPAVNYPFEDGIATKAGRLLGGFCDRWLQGAAGVTLVSHSLGARVILEAIKASGRRIQRACIAAGAVNDRCLVEEYAAAAANCDVIVTLSSLKDTVLEYAFPPGDALADVIFADHPEGEGALGRRGPASPIPARVTPYEIDEKEGFNHGDYFPPGAAQAGDLNAKWVRSAAFIAAVARGRLPSWPLS